uniref:Putative 13.1 kDa salivary protein n=1 Tax=Culex tarsalis TaxID=7177 RepID=A0A1Q3EUW2_CULTA
MKSVHLLLVVLTLSAVALAQVPTGCVHLKNRYVSKFLGTANNHDADRRNVEYDTAAQKWTITKEGDWYKIKHKDLGEELIESVQNYNGNYIFTWIPKSVVNDGGAEWKIYGSGRAGQYYIKNKKLNHCVFANEWSHRVKALGGCSEWNYEWEIIPVSC